MDGIEASENVLHEFISQVLTRVFIKQGGLMHKKDLWNNPSDEKMSRSIKFMQKKEELIDAAFHGMRLHALISGVCVAPSIRQRPKQQQQYWHCADGDVPLPSIHLPASLHN